MNRIVENVDQLPRTIGELLEQRAEELKGHAALVGNDGEGTYRSLSYRELFELAGSISGFIKDVAGLTASATGFRVGWVYGNDNPLVGLTIYHAVALGGGVNVPINPASTHQEISQIAERAELDLLIAPSVIVEQMTQSPNAAVAVDTLKQLQSLGGSANFQSYSIDTNSPVVILFTSGTTGRSKGVVHSHRTALASGLGWQRAFGFGISDVYQSSFPVFAGGGLHFNGLACVIGRATYVIDEARPTSESLDRIERYRSTVFGAVPSIYQYWLAEDLNSRDLSSLRLLDFGGAVMHSTTIQALHEALPGIQLIQTYGLTEAGPGGLYLAPEFVTEKLGSIGNEAIGDLRYRIVPVEGYEGEGHEFGELQFAGTSLMLHYLDDEEATAKVFDGEWMRTGDLVSKDSDGFMYFVDRLKDLIVRGGYNISSIEVEEAIAKHPAVASVSVFGVPHSALGEVVGAAIVPKDGQSLDLLSVRRFIVEALARVKVPQKIVVLPELPLTPAGKVNKKLLKEHQDLRDWT